ncbi:MAG: PHP domain-containing protein [Myxococcota bacterium]
MWGSCATRLAVCAAAASSLAGCAALPWPSGADRGLAPRAGAEFVDLRGAVHVHTRVSHDSKGDIGEIVDAAHGAGLAFVAFTEHPYHARLRPARGVVEGVILIPGWEVRCAGASILALGVERDGLPEEPRELVDEIHRRGGAAFVAHFEASQLADPARFAEAAPDGIEIVNLHASALEVRARLALGELFLPAPWALGVLLRPPTQNLERFAQLHGVHALVGGVDAHAKFRVLGPLGGTLDRYRDVFRLVTTHVLARQRSEKGVLEALRAGRSYVAFEGIAPVEHFAAERAADGYAVRAPEAARLELVCAGTVVDRAESAEAVLHAPPDAERCHVEAWLGSRLWVITSPLG